jgi:hypothetical protein
LICGLVFLHLFSTALAPAAQRAASTPKSSWITADFDGNRTIDFALSRTVAHDRSGYMQEVRVQLGASLPSFFAFHSRSAGIQLGARDIDGDHDFDIVVMDGFSLVPVGIWLNDGTGNFSEGDLAQYKGALDTHSSTSLKPPQTAADLLFAILAPDSQPALFLACTAEPERAAEVFAQEIGGFHPARRPIRLRNRAPPRNS